MGGEDRPVEGGEQVEEKKGQDRGGGRASDPHDHREDGSPIFPRATNRGREEQIEEKVVATDRSWKLRPSARRCPRFGFPPPPPLFSSILF